MKEVLELIQQHGELFYLITFFWTALEGESFVIFAAILAQRGMLSIELLFAAAWLGSFFGDQVYFFVGRHFGSWILGRWPHIKPKLEKVFGWVEKNSTLFILTYRFMYGIRNVSSVALGMSRLSWKRFGVLNFIAAGIWAGSFCGFGYLFGDIVMKLKKREEVVEHSITYELTLIVLIAIVTVFALRHFSHYWQEKRGKATACASQQAQSSADPE